MVETLKRYKRQLVSEVLKHIATTTPKPPPPSTTIIFRFYGFAHSGFMTFINDFGTVIH